MANTEHQVEIETYTSTEAATTTFANGEEVIVVGSLGNGPQKAPAGSLWGRQEDVDFFLPPAMSLETLDYVELEEGQCAAEALRKHFGLPTEAVPKI